MSIWLLEDDDLATGEGLPINAPQQTTSGINTNTFAHRSAASLLLDSALTPSQYVWPFVCMPLPFYGEETEPHIVLVISLYR